MAFADLVSRMDAVVADRLDVVRPYTVSVVRRTWSGARRSEGAPSDVEVELDPTPTLVEGRQVGLQPQAFGIEDELDAMLLEVPFTFTEDELYQPSDLAANEEHFYRVRSTQADTEIADRFYAPKSRPKAMSISGLGWTVELRRVQDAP